MGERQRPSGSSVGFVSVCVFTKTWQDILVVRFFKFLRRGGKIKDDKNELLQSWTGLVEEVLCFQNKSWWLGS